MARKKYKPRTNVATGRTTKKIRGTMIMVDCIRCGGGASRCGLCRKTNGKTAVSR